MLNEQLINSSAEPAAQSAGPTTRQYRLFGALCVLATTAVLSSAQGVAQPQTPTSLMALAEDGKDQQIVLPKELKHLTAAGFNQAMYCFAELFDKEETGSPNACKADSQQPLQVLFAVILVFGLFLFAPYYLFPEASFALVLRKGFPAAFLPFFPALGNAPSATIVAVQDTLCNVAIASLVLRLCQMYFGSSKNRPDLTSTFVSLAVSAGMFYGFHQLVQ